MCYWSSCKVLQIWLYVSKVMYCMCIVLAKYYIFCLCISWLTIPFCSIYGFLTVLWISKLWQGLDNMRVVFGITGIKNYVFMITLLQLTPKMLVSHFLWVFSHLSFCHSVYGATKKKNPRWHTLLVPGMSGWLIWGWRCAYQLWGERSGDKNTPGS